jgi:hypothetical protein
VVPIESRPPTAQPIGQAVNFFGHDWIGSAADIPAFVTVDIVRLFLRLSSSGLCSSRGSSRVSLKFHLGSHGIRIGSLLKLKCAFAVRTKSASDLPETWIFRGENISQNRSRISITRGPSSWIPCGYSDTRHTRRLNGSRLLVIALRKTRLVSHSCGQNDGNTVLKEEKRRGYRGKDRVLSIHLITLRILLSRDQVPP